MSKTVTSSPHRIFQLPTFLRLLRRFEFPFKLGILERYFGRKLAAHGTQWVRCWNGVIWKLDFSEPCHRWIIYGKYEGGQGLDFAASKLRDGGVLVDSGANIGQWLIYLAQLNNVRSFAIEPVSTEREWLRQCLKHQTNWDVTILPYGLSDKVELLEIQCDAARSTLNMDWFVGKNLPRETIHVARLDQLLTEQGVDRITFWKLDVEGAEFEALVGARYFLENHLIETIYFECNSANYSKVAALLKENGYGIFRMHKGRTQPFDATTIPHTLDLIAQILA